MKIFLKKTNIEWGKILTMEFNEEKKNRQRNKTMCIKKAGVGLCKEFEIVLC